MAVSVEVVVMYPVLVTALGVPKTPAVMMDFVLVDDELLARRKRFPRKEKKPL